MSEQTVANTPAVQMPIVVASEEAASTEELEIRPLVSEAAIALLHRLYVQYGAKGVKLGKFREKSRQFLWAAYPPEADTAELAKLTKDQIVDLYFDELIKEMRSFPGFIETTTGKVTEVNIDPAHPPTFWDEQD